MIGILVGGAWPLLQKFWKPILLVVAVMALYGFGYVKGDAHRDRVWQAVIAGEKLAQEVVVAEANEKAAAEVTRLNDDLEKSNALNLELQAAAAADVNANRPALGVDGVRRILRSGAHKPK